MPNKTVDVDLNAVTSQNGEPLMGRSDEFSEVAILDLANGATLELRVGQGDWFRVPAPLTLKPTGSDRTSGLRYRNLIAQPGVTTQIIVVSGTELNPALA